MIDNSSFRFSLINEDYCIICKGDHRDRSCGITKKPVKMEWFSKQPTILAGMYVTTTGKPYSLAVELPSANNIVGIALEDVYDDEEPRIIKLSL